MIQFLVAAPRSGSGKTTVTCALLAALKRRGLNPCSFKSGPDYIDPMFHRSALHVDSHNLDLFLSSSVTVREVYAHYSAGHGAAVCEGAMGFYDGPPAHGNWPIRWTFPRCWSSSPKAQV